MRTLLLSTLFLPFALLAQKIPIYNANTFFLSSSNIVDSNILVSANIQKTKGANGQVTLATSTNLSAGLITVSSNYALLSVTQFAGTNSTANTNITLNVDAGIVNLYLTNNASFTNFSGLAVGKAVPLLVRIFPQSTTRAIVWPTLGAPGYGIRIYTNANAPMWTSFTNGNVYALALDIDGTNIWAALSEWK